MSPMLQQPVLLLSLGERGRPRALGNSSGRTFLVEGQLVEPESAGFLAHELVRAPGAQVVQGHGVRQGLHARLQAEGNFGVACGVSAPGCIGGGGGGGGISQKTPEQNRILGGGGRTSVHPLCTEKRPTARG